MDSSRNLEYVLSDKYDPAGDTPFKFRQNYIRLVEHRDDLQKKHDAKEQKRADMQKAESSTASAASSTVQGSRFSTLPDNDSGSTTPPPTKHKFSARPTDFQLDSFPHDKRKAEVAKIKREIQVLKDEKKKKRAVGAAGSQNEGIREGIKKQADLDVAKEEEEEGAEKSEQGLEWKTVIRSDKR